MGKHRQLRTIFLKKIQSLYGQSTGSEKLGDAWVIQMVRADIQGGCSKKIYTVQGGSIETF